MTNTITGSKDIGREDQQNYRIALRYRPLGDDDIVFNLSRRRADIDSTPFALVLPTAGGDLFDHQL